MKSKFEVFLDTDILLQSLSVRKFKEDTVFKKSLVLFDHCYTSVINAAELFSGFSGKKASEKVKRSLVDVGILGIPFRYSISIADMMKATDKYGTGNNLRDAVILAMCAETRLPILTSNESRYKELAKKFKVKIISEETVRNNTSPELIFKKAKIL